MIATTSDPVSKYFEAFANRVLLNRCPYCNVGMIVDAPTVRACPKCGYSDDSENTPFKFKLRFDIYQEPGNKQALVVAIERPTDKESFHKAFQDIFTAQRYVDAMTPCCIVER